MTVEPSAAPRRRTWIVVALVLAAVVLGALVVRARRQGASAADCEKAPPKVTFAVAECDAGSAPPAGGPARPPAPAARP